MPQCEPQKGNRRASKVRTSEEAQVRGPTPLLLGYMTLSLTFDSPNPGFLIRKMEIMSVPSS